MKRTALFLLAWIAAGATAQQEASQQDLDKLEAAIAKLQRDLGVHRGQHSKLQKQLRKSELAIGEVNASIRNNQALQRSLETELVDLRRRQRQLEADRSNQQALIAAQMRSAYQLGNEKSLKVLLNQEDPARISRAMAYVDYFNRARLAEVEAFTNTIDELQTLEPTIADKVQALEHTGEQLAVEKRELDRQLASRQQTLASLTRTIAGTDAQLQQREEDRKRLETLLSTVEDISANFAGVDDAQPFSARKGKMGWPAEGRIVNRFGTRRHQGGLQWQGVEIRAAEGENVRAIHHGRVVFADWLGGQGLLIIIDHGDGYLSLYGHNQTLLRETGDWIRSGEPIATVGDSGGRSQPGLYFEIRHKGVARNPGQWCDS